MRTTLLLILLLLPPALCRAQGFYTAQPVCDRNITLDARNPQVALKLDIPMYTVRIIYAITPIAPGDTAMPLLQEVRRRLPRKIDWLGVEAISRQLALPMLPDSLSAALYHRKGCVKRFAKKRRSRCISYLVEPLVSRSWHHEWPASIFNEKAYLCLRLPNNGKPLSFRIQAVAVQAY